MTLIELAIQKGHIHYFNKKQEEYNKEEWVMELALLTSWIRENFGIHISISFDKYEQDGMKYAYAINKINIEEKFGFEHNDYKYSFNSPEEATEKALLYTLKHLI